MYKWIVAFVAIIFLGDPSLSFLETIGESKDLVVAMVLALVAVPWVVSVFDN